MPYMSVTLSSIFQVLCGHALRSVAHSQSKCSANVLLTLTGKPNPAQITLWHKIYPVDLIVFFSVYNEILEKMYQLKLQSHEKQTQDEMHLTELFSGVKEHNF